MSNSSENPIIIDGVSVEREFKISKNDLKLFNSSVAQLRNILRRIEFFNIRYEFKTWFERSNEEFSDCYHWQIDQTFSFKNKSFFQVSVDIIKLNCVGFFLTRHREQQHGVKFRGPVPMVELTNYCFC